MEKLENIAEEDRTLIFYESTHRILDTLEDMQSMLGEERYIVLAREITKTWETITGNTIKKFTRMAFRRSQSYKRRDGFDCGRQTKV